MYFPLARFRHRRGRSLQRGGRDICDRRRADVERLVRAGRGRRAGAVIVFNGNAGNRAYRSDLASQLAARGLAVLLFDYRGYGENPGSPTEEGLARDARAARRYVLSRDEVNTAACVLRRVSRVSRRGEVGGRASTERRDPAIAVHVVRGVGPASLSHAASQLDSAGPLSVDRSHRAGSAARCSSSPARTTRLSPPPRAGVSSRPHASRNGS